MTDNTPDMSKPKKPTGKLLTDRWMTATEAAKEKGISHQAITNAIHEGRLPAVKFGRNWAIRKSDVDAYKTFPNRGRRKKEETDGEG